MKKWLLLSSKPRQELTAQRHLAYQGFETYIPFVSRERRVGDTRTRIVTEPLFPNYVFVHTDPVVQSIAPVRSTRGVNNFVRFGSSMAIVADEIIENIRERVAASEEPIAAPPAFACGDVVHINGRGFDNIEAVFSCSCGETRAVILLDILGRRSRVTVPTRYLAKAQ